MQNTQTNSSLQNPTINQERLKSVKENALDSIIPQKRGWAWSSLQVRPDAKVSTLYQSEKIYIIGRRHWISNISWIVNNIFYLFIPVIIFLILNFLNVILNEISLRTYFVIILAFYSVVLTNVIRDFFDWYFDPLIITNERILDFEFKPFTSYIVKDARLETIQKVNERSVGLFPSLFNFGDITVTTEATEGKLVFEQVKNPQMVRRVMDQLIEISKKFNYAG